MNPAALQLPAAAPAPARLALCAAPAAAPLPAALAPVAAALNAADPPVGALPVEEVTKLFNQLLSRAALLLGHKTWQDGGELYVLARACADLVQRRYRGLKAGEIMLAFDRGAAGEYKAKPDDVVYVQLPAVTAWLYAYQTTARHEALQALRRADEAVEPAPPPATPRDLLAEVAALVALAHAGQLPPAEDLDFANVIYGNLKAAGWFRPDGWPAGPPDYEEIRAEETEALLMSPQPNDRAERRLRRTFLDCLADEGRWPDNHPLALSVGNACKKRVLREWVMQCAAEDTDVAALLAPHAPSLDC